MCLTQDLREELEYWRFLDTWEESVPWRSEYHCRLDASVDSQVLIGVWEGEGSRKSRQLCSVTKHLFKLVSQRNLQLKLSDLVRTKRMLPPAGCPVWMLCCRIELGI